MGERRCCLYCTAPVSGWEVPPEKSVFKENNEVTGNLAPPLRPTPREKGTRSWVLLGPLCRLMAQASTSPFCKAGQQTVQWYPAYIAAPKTALEPAPGKGRPG